MKKSKVCDPVLICVSTVILGASSALAQNTQQPAISSTDKDNRGLRLSLVSETSEGPFRAELQNTGDRILTLNLGIVLGNREYPDQVHLLLEDPKGKLLHLDLRGPATINGRVDLLVVSLLPGATSSLLLDLRNYVSFTEKVWSLSLIPGKYTLIAEYRSAGDPYLGAKPYVKGISLLPSWIVPPSYWVGMVRSAPLPFTLTRQMEPQTAR